MKILVAVIAYNEEKNIATTLRDLEEHNFGFDVVVIDNGSVDNTCEIAEAMGHKVVKHCINTGGSMGTVSTYYLYAWKNNYDILCQFDGDGQHLAKELKKIVTPVMNGEADYVIGSRFIEKIGFQSSFIRRVCIGLFSYFCSHLAKAKITDITSGFRAYSRQTITFFGKNYRKEIYDINHQLLLAALSGARVKEVAVVMQERKFGVSEFSSLKAAISFPLKGTINIFGAYLQKKTIYRLMRMIHGSYT